MNETQGLEIYTYITEGCEYWKGITNINFNWHGFLRIEDRLSLKPH
jgi:hypothetical protein